MGEQHSSPAVSDPSGAPFPYSPENPPSLAELEGNLYAIHATRRLPPDNILRPGAMTKPDGSSFDEEPPSFRPTLHFSLGGMAKKHGNNSWEDASYAVVTPLDRLAEQLVNVFPLDTFTLGNVMLDQEGVVLMVPEGTDTSHLPIEVATKAYPPSSTLREAVDRHITEQGGWRIDTNIGQADLGAPAYISGVQINDERFFSPLLEASPHLSYGVHPRSITGEAFRFGVAEQAVSNALYSLETGGYDPTLAVLEAALAKHSLRKLEEALHASPLDRAALATFSEKKAAALDWLNIIECDKNLGKTYGVTLASAPPDILNKAKALRRNKDALWEFASSKKAELHKTPDTSVSPENYDLLGELCSGMSRQELSEWVGENHALFDTLNLPYMEVFYALVRSVMVGDLAREEEGLDQLLASSLEKLAPENVQKNRKLIVGVLMPYLEKDSTFLRRALRQLDLPAVSNYLQLAPSKHAMTTLGDFISRHPDTSILAEPETRSPKQQEIIDSLIASQQFSHDPIPDVDSFRTFNQARGAAREKGAREHLRTILWNNYTRKKLAP